MGVYIYPRSLGCFICIIFNNKQNPTKKKPQPPQPPKKPNQNTTIQPSQADMWSLR